MNRTRLFFTICTFLCAASSIDAQDWAREAVECERIVFQAEDPYEVNDALIHKAQCYMKLDRWEEAASTLGRVRMYMLTPEEQEEVLLEKALCLSMAGDGAGAMSQLQQLAAGESPLSRAIKAGLEKAGQGLQERKSEDKAMLRALLPPLGHSYTGHTDEGLISLGLNAAAAGWTIWQCLSGCWISGLVGGGIALNTTFGGNQERSMELVGEYNDSIEAERARRIKALILSFIPAE